MIDLTATSETSGAFMLSWHYRNLGDYDQDGIVGVNDLAPIAANYGEVSAPENEWTDGDSSGNIGIGDITPIAMNFAADCSGYVVEGSLDGVSFSDVIATVPFAAGFGSARLDSPTT